MGCNDDGISKGSMGIDRKNIETVIVLLGTRPNKGFAACMIRELLSRDGK